MSRRHPEDPPGYNRRWPNARPPCSTGCGAVAVGRGLCDKHYKRWRRHGDPSTVAVPAGRRIGPGGYAYVYAPKHPLAQTHGYVAEHRKVVHDAGLPLSADDHVHHVNGDKQDNRLENLLVVTNSEHHAEHRPVGALVRNQYGTFPVRRRRSRARADA